MADIVIRGMEMPKDTTKVEIGIDADGHPLCIAYNESGNEPDIYDVVPLTEGHRDLIERKRLDLVPDYKDVRNGIKRIVKETKRDGKAVAGISIELLEQTIIALDELRAVRRYFENAKTIVPAEGED